MHFYLIRPLKMTFIGVTQGSQTTKDSFIRFKYYPEIRPTNQFSPPTFGMTF